MSTRIPFGRFLKVGGNRENKEKYRVSPDADAPSTVTVKVLFVVSGEEVGFKGTVTCVQTFSTPVTGTEADAKRCPLIDSSATVMAPLKFEPVGSI